MCYVLFVVLIASYHFSFSQDIYFKSPQAIVIQEEAAKNSYFSYPILSTDNKFIYFTSTDSIRNSSSLKRSSNINGAYWHIPEKITISKRDDWSIVGMNQTKDTVYLIDQSEKIIKYVYSIPSSFLFRDFSQKKSLNRFFRLSSNLKQLHSINVHSSG